MNESFNVTPGGAVESYQPRNAINQIYGVWVDNFSGGWLGIEGRNLWIPPYTRGWKASIFPGMSSITIRSYDFANGARITGATGQAATVTLWDEDKGDSEGTEFFNQQTVPIVAVFTNPSTPVAPYVILPVPITGRYRIYEIQFTYYPGFGLAQNAEALSAHLYSSSRNLVLLTISPASPIDRTTIVSPGGDLPIGEALQAEIFSIENFNAGSGTTAINIRYAVL